jgi:hypothetical protein
MHYFFVGILRLGFIAINAFILFQCSNSKSVTPQKYRNNTVIDGFTYDKHMAQFKDSILNLIYYRNDPYYQLENDSLTKVFIDTILYSPKMNKFSFFAITQNSNAKLLSTEDKNQFHYSAHCFIGKLNENREISNFQWVKGYNLSNYKSLSEISRRIREVYFREITQRTNNEGESTYKYNFDDIRFWEGPLWDVYY